jgi:hypothetical protein
MAARLSLREPAAWAVLLLAALFLAIAGLFVLRPADGAALFGIALEAPGEAFYVRAVGFRDLALAVYLAGLTLAGERKGLVVLLWATPVIPAGDMLLLASAGAAAPYYLLHLGSMACFAALAWWVRRSGDVRA